MANQVWEGNGQSVALKQQSGFSHCTFEKRLAGQTDRRRNQQRSQWEKAEKDLLKIQFCTDKTLAEAISVGSRLQNREDYTMLNILFI